MRLAEPAKAAGVERFVYISSCSVYGAGGDEMRTEESRDRPADGLRAMQDAGRARPQPLADDDFSPTFLRNATAYGASPRMRFDLVLNNLSGFAWTTGEIKMTSDGSPWRPLVHVADICEAILLRARRAARGRAQRGLQRRPHDANYRVREIAEIVADAFPGCELSIGNSGGDNRSYRVNFDKITDSLPGFKCHRDAERGAAPAAPVFERIGMTRSSSMARLHPAEVS